MSRLVDADLSSFAFAFDDECKRLHAQHVLTLATLCLIFVSPHQFREANVDDLKANVMRGIEALTAQLVRLATSDDAAAGAAHVAVEALYHLADQLAGEAPEAGEAAPA